MMQSQVLRAYSPSAAPAVDLLAAGLRVDVGRALEETMARLRAMEEAAEG